MSGPAGGAPPLALRAHWKDVVEGVRASSRVAFFLDLDGTLAPLTPRPEQARVPAETKEVLRRLAAHRKATVTVISGRRRAVLERLVRVPDVQCWGLYGAETRGDFSLRAAERRALGRAREELVKRIPRSTGIWIEDKRASLSVHLRGVREPLRLPVRRAVRMLAHVLRRDLRLIENLHDAELVPRRVGGKGEAVRRYLARRKRGSKLLAVYCGDDYSDEPAFAAVAGGVAILVGPERRTRARFRLPSPRELTQALRDFEEILP
ncbi:MAG TPA: trehalose-phosphatase [Methylomirabilota bacterium]|nr:trehalose-phosphatase [Methylomirabilota bacterium]